MDKRKGLVRVVGVVAIMVCVLFVFCACFEEKVRVSEEYELIRIHIRANSNDEADQRVKLRVRDVVTEYLNTNLSDVTDRESAYEGISGLRTKIKGKCDEVLKDEGFGYRSSIKLTNEYFPTRQYENVVVESGYYDALIIELGEGAGDNWWCVIYPPLCYLEAEYGNGFRYKSKLKELIDKYFG